MILILWSSSRSPAASWPGRRAAEPGLAALDRPGEPRRRPRPGLGALGAEPRREPREGAWLEEVSLRWVDQLGIRFHLAADGLSLLLILLTAFLGILSVAAS